MKKKITVELEYSGDGSIKFIEGGFRGCVVPPKIKNVRFFVHPAAIDENGILNPIDGEDSYNGGLQIDISGNSKFYEEIGKYFLALSKLNTNIDPGYHEHFDVIVSEDERTKINLILRKES